MAAKILDLPQTDGQAEEQAIKGVVLGNAILTGIKGVESLIPGLIDLYLKHMQLAETTDLQKMLLQGVMVCLWYDQATALA